MKDVVNNLQISNDITTPLLGSPSYRNSGIIKAVMKTGDKVSIGQIDYEEFDDENFQYVITPYWEIIDGLPASIFQGIPGINMELRLKHYYRVNYIPTFVMERTPSKNREDLWELLESVGLDYYDRFEWLLRTELRSANDNLIVERKQKTKVLTDYSLNELSILQYGDMIVIDSLESIADTPAKYNDFIFNVVLNGIDVKDKSGNIIIDTNSRSAIGSIVIAGKIIAHRELVSKRNAGIKKAKAKGKYTGRKPIDVDNMLLKEVYGEFKKGFITLDEAMKRTKINSKSTFYRKIKEI